MGFWGGLLGICAVALGIYMATRGGTWFFIGLIILVLGISGALVNAK